MKVAVGLSGGVDSAVTAALLQEQGHEVVGVFMKNWSGDDFGIQGDCPWEKEQKDAQSVAEHLGIEFLSYNFEQVYREKVVEYFFAEYKAGRTPNPDVLCNSEIKFNVFLRKCLHELKVDKIATGHYARNIFDGAKYDLLKGVDPNKDQAYFLCRLTQPELSQSLFPLGNLTKPEVRELAKRFMLPVAEKKDSQGICFIGKINVKEFIESELGSKPGNVIDIDTGKVLGKHQGLWFHTIGQREGLGFSGGPWFVVKKDLQENIIYAAKGKDNPALYSKTVIATDLNIINEDALSENFKAEVSIRYRQKPSPATVTYTNNELNITFDSPQRAVSPGQFACIYLGDTIIASGIIQ
jgi:tRNA-uridine 2-sulfurtransferase